MPLKKNNPDVKHVVVSDLVDRLDAFVLTYLSSGYRLVEAKVINWDYHNRVGVMFYLFVRGDAEE